ncbi:MAG: hypothetical protein JW703_01950 [Candidatus Diapherotrites archaeon]|nr:hypothetical protein [Candidatus Diapherotrites archaeon]
MPRKIMRTKYSIHPEKPPEPKNISKRETIQKILKNPNSTMEQKTWAEKELKKMQKK